MASTWPRQNGFFDMASQKWKFQTVTTIDTHDIWLISLVLHTVGYEADIPALIHSHLRPK